MTKLLFNSFPSFQSLPHEGMLFFLPKIFCHPRKILLNLTLIEKEQGQEIITKGKLEQQLGY